MPPTSAAIDGVASAEHHEAEGKCDDTMRACGALGTSFVPGGRVSWYIDGAVKAVCDNRRHGTSCDKSMRFFVQETQ